MVYKKFQKVPNEYYCEKCDYYTNRKSQFERHIQTKKHNGINGISNGIKKYEYICECGKSYKYQPGLSRHKRKCQYLIDTMDDTDEISIPNNNSDIKQLTNMVVQLVEKNNELQTQLIEMAKEPKTIIKQQNNFNMENFLNIECRDAMNLSEFLDQIDFGFDDLLYLGEHGFVDSVRQTFVKQLRDLDQTRRPIHCSDKKRKTLMIKNNDKWHKDNNHDLIQDAITKVNKKQIGAFSEHSKQRPENYLHDEKNLDRQNGMIINMCSYNNENKTTMDKKIIKELSDVVQIKK